MSKKVLITVLLFLVMLSSAFAVGTAPDPADTVSYWAMEDLTDLTGNGNTLTNVGADSGATGIIDDAFSFVKSNTDHMYDASSKATYSFMQNTGVFTLSMWVKQDSYNSGGLAFLSGTHRGSSSEKGHLLSYNDGSMTFNLAKSVGYTVSITGSNVITDNDYHHILITGDGSDAYMYVDGVEEVTGTITGVSTLDSTGDLYISKSHSAGNFYLDGEIDEFMISDAYSTTDNVDYLYNAGSPATAQQWDFPSASSPPDTLTITAKDIDNSSSILVFNATLNTNTTFTTTNGTIYINVTASGFNESLLQNYTIVSANYFNQTYTDWNTSTPLVANITQHPFVIAHDIYSNTSLTNFNVVVRDVFGGIYQNTTTTTGKVYYRCNDILTFCNTEVNVYIEAFAYASYSSISYNFSNADLNASLTPDPLEDFTLITPNDTFANGTSFNITWTQAISPTNKTVTYNGEISHLSNGTVVDTFAVTDLYFDLDISAYDASVYNVSVVATEAFSGDSFTQESTLSASGTNYLYFYNEQTGGPIVGANVTVDFPNLLADVIFLTDSLGRIDFDSFQNETLQTGVYQITFEDYDGFVSPLVINRTYNTLPVNESFNITVTNINISIFYRSNFSAFLQNATVTIEGVSSQTVSNGSVFLQNATIANGEYRVTVSADGYFNEEKTFTFTGQDDLDLNIYMLELNSSNSGTVIIRSIDEFSRLLDNAQINLLEYDPDTLSYLEVSECYTDSNGECKFLIETNTKSYKFTASRVINGITVTASTEPEIFADSIVGGETVVFTEETRTLTLSSVDQFQVSPLQNIIFSITPYDESFNNVTNQSNIAVSFNSIDGTSITVCVEYFSIVGGVKTSLTGNTFCLTGSSGEVTEDAFFTLNRSKDYVADIYLRTGSGDFNLDSYKYYSDASFLAKLQANGMLPYFVIFVWIFLIGGTMMLKNISLTGVAIVIGAWVLWAFFPSGIMVSVAVLQTVLGANAIYLGRKREDFG